jgi:hypothetical protein
MMFFTAEGDDFSDCSDGDCDGIIIAIGGDAELFPGLASLSGRDKSTEKILLGLLIFILSPLLLSPPPSTTAIILLGTSISVFKVEELISCRAFLFTLRIDVEFEVEVEF